MWIPDMPNVPPQNVPVMIAQANQAQAGDKTKVRAFGQCYPVPSNYYDGENTLSPLVSAEDYFLRYEPQTTFTGTATLTVLQQPQHGVLRLMTEADGNRFGEGRFVAADQLYVYLPEKDYLGDDKATFLVERGGIEVKVVYFFKAVNGPLGNTGAARHCNKTGTEWKISSTLNPNGTSTITSVEYQSAIIDTGATTTDTATQVSTLSASILSTFSVDPSLVTFNLADLVGGVVGQAIGNTITLDDNAAGHNWFIDPTPWDNSEYLPTSNPYEWVAKAGTAAYGKMDMLSVLLHEYGHALGIDHSADGHDYMATTLTPGVRRMPSAEEMALMQSLVGQLKGEMTATASTPSLTLPLQGGGDQDVPLPIPLGAGFGMAFIGRMRKGSYGSSIDVVGAPSNPQYAVAANATFANLATPAGWNTQGSVDFATGTSTGTDPSTGSGTSTSSVRTDSVTLNEVSASQTRLSQVFMLNDKDRYLSFTLSGTALDDLTGAPNPLSNFPPQAGERANGAASGSGSGSSDAFEVALLDANTGANLLGGIGLSHSDAFLNLQGDGTEHAAAGVIRTDYADGSSW